MAKERQILFSGPMVRALLAGTKTQTRRIVKGVPSREHYGRDIMDWGLSGIHQAEDDLVGTDRWALDVQTDVDDYSRTIIRCPYGAPGDSLWVRERSWIYGQWHADGLTKTGRKRWRFKAIGRRVLYENPGHDQIAHLGGGPGWSHRNSLHMPRWASRITLEITGVRVERLNDCSEVDAMAEGVEPPETEREDHDWSICPACGGTGLHGSLGDNLGYREVDCTDCDTHAKRYRHLWNAINGPGSWDANPWVWVVEFRRLAEEKAVA